MDHLICTKLIYLQLTPFKIYTGLFYQSDLRVEVYNKTFSLKFCVLFYCIQNVFPQLRSLAPSSHLDRTNLWLYFDEVCRLTPLEASATSWPQLGEPRLQVIIRGSTYSQWISPHGLKIYKTKVANVMLIVNMQFLSPVSNVRVTFPFKVLIATCLQMIYTRSKLSLNIIHLKSIVLRLHLLLLFIQYICFTNDEINYFPNISAKCLQNCLTLFHCF